jgi:hypothetical protein
MFLQQLDYSSATAAGMRSIARLPRRASYTFRTAFTH